jgi:hypothetical protein
LKKENSNNTQGEHSAHNHKGNTINLTKRGCFLYRRCHFESPIVVVFWSFLSLVTAGNHRARFKARVLQAFSLLSSNGALAPFIHQPSHLICGKWIGDG